MSRAKLLNDSRGSYWRMWDLHIHTPASFHWNGGKRFREMMPEEKVASLNDMVTTINDSDVAVFCIADYWTFDGYNAVMSHVAAGKAELTKTIFPGMEFRIEAPVDYRLNMQVLLSNELTQQQRADFKAALRLRGTDRGISEEALIEFARSLDPSKARKHGFSGNYANNELELLELGSQTAEITKESLRDAIKTIPPETCLIILPYDTSDGLKDLDWAAHPCADNYFMQSAHIFETRSPENVDLFIGRKTEKNKAFFDNFMKTMGGKPKPPISGSDAHRIQDYGKFPGDRITWIKADPTFAGLLKILIEPAERTFIGTIPYQLQNIENYPTKFISQITISKKSGSTLDEHWFDCDLPVNPGLVAIIGNKGSGKSALGETVGLLGRTQYAAAFSFLSEKRFRQPRNNKSSHFEGHLYWMSGSSQSSGLDVDPSLNAYELVKYIPQHFLEQLCNELGKPTETSFDQELRSVIFSHVKEEDRLGCSSLEDLIKYKTSQANKKIDLLKQELSALTDRIVVLEKKATREFKTKLEGALGAKQHELQTHTKNKLLEVLKPQALPEQREKLQKLTEQLAVKKLEMAETDSAISETRKELAAINLLISTAERLLALVDNFERQSNTFKAEAAPDIEKLGLQDSQIFTVRLSKKPITEKRSTLIQEKIKLEGKLNKNDRDSLSKKSSTIAESIKNIQEKLDAPHKEYESYLEKQREWEKTKLMLIGTKETPGTIEFYKAKIVALEQIPNDLRTQRIAEIEKSKEIFIEKAFLAKTYQALYRPIQEFIDSNPVAKEELRLLFKVEIADTGFADTFFSFISQGVRGSYCGTEEGHKRLAKLLSASDLSSKEGLAKFLDLLLASLLTDQREGGTVTEIESLVKKGQTVQGLYDFIFGLEYLSPKYSLGIAGKDLHELSPGERGALLLIFYLLVDQGDVPLIIDQPEENLDNQTVYRLLVPSIKEAKKRRQIMIITHNPNLAVVCDAEQIVCCYLDKKDKYRLKYTSGAIENPEVNKALLDILEGTRPAFDNREAKYLSRTK